MYDTTNVIIITKDDVLKKISEYEIYSLYLGFKPVIGELYISPLRADNNPSFGIFKARKTGNLLFKDLGTGESGDCFKLASLIEGKTVRQICKELIKETVSKNITRKPIPIPTKEYKTLDIIVDDIPYTAEGLAFWTDFGISQATLNYFKVKQIKRFWVNSVEMWTATKSKPMFSYFIYSKTKVYRPFYKQNKFYMNCTSVDIQGWEQMLDKLNKGTAGDTIIISKAYKDVMLLHELGYTAVAPNGEGHGLPDNAMAFLRKNFKKIIIFYDRDLPGLKATRKLWNENRDFDFMFTPRKTEKDLSDYYKKFGKELTLKLLSDGIKNTIQTDGRTDSDGD
jgi:hypothetical protein